VDKFSKIQLLYKKIITNKIFHFIGSRYVTYFLQFVNSLLIAVNLGLYYLGIWGFIMLVTQYLNQSNFGISHSVNAIISINKRREWYVQKVIGTSLTMLGILSLVMIVLFIINELCNFNFGSKYNFSTYAPFVIIIGVLGYFNTLFSNIFRVYGRLYEIAFNQTIFPILTLFSVIIFRKENLLWALIIANTIAFLSSFIMYLLRCPIKLKMLFIWKLIIKIQIKGWYLFIYSLSFYLIVISTRSFVSAYYGVEEFGSFTFSFSLANSILLLLQAISFLIFPKLLNRFAISSEKETFDILTSVRDTYIVVSHGLIHFAIMLFPCLLLFLPQYQNTANVFNMIALSIVLYTNCFGYQGFLIAKGKERKLSVLSLFSLIINIVIALVLIKIFKVPFYQVIFSTLISYIIYMFLIGYNGRKALGASLKFKDVIRDVFPLRIFIPFSLSVCICLFELNVYYGMIPFVVFICFNIGVLGKVYTVLKRIVNEPKFINI